jgi:uncharacterized protein (TIGR00255 family)
VLLSMTGHGEARVVQPHLTLSIELRAVNNRYLKVNWRAPEPYNQLEAEAERHIRQHLHRGSVQATLRVQRVARVADFPLNTVALRAYVEQVRIVCGELAWPEAAPALLAGVLALPGVAPDSVHPSLNLQEDWPIIAEALTAALGQLDQMRRVEGQAMAGELLGLLDQIDATTARLREYLPSMVQTYQNRVVERVRKLLADSGVTLEAKDLIRETAIFADRADISEELTRLASHVEQARALIGAEEGESPGRRLEFLTQEMGREANTIGSKAGDVFVARQAIELKAILERFRELIQNIE